MPTRNVTLTKHLNDFIESGVTSGRFADASEIVGEGLRLLQQSEQQDVAKLAWLRTTATEAFGQLDQGDGLRFSSIDELTAHIDRVGAEISDSIETERKVG